MLKYILLALSFQHCIATFQFAGVFCYNLKEKLTSCLLMGHELSAKNNRNKDLMRHTPYYKENKEEH